MAERFSLGAYWGPRGETVEECARRLGRLLGMLAAVDPLLATWFRTAGSRKAAVSRPVDPSAEALTELLRRGQARRDDDARSVMSELGYAVDVWNGQEAAVGLRVRCGSAASIQGMTSNTLVLQLPSPVGAASTLYRRDVAISLLRAVVTVWDPAWATWTSNELRKAQEPAAGGVVFGWGTYLGQPQHVSLERLPVGVTAEPVGSGVLIVAENDADSATGLLVTQLRRALGPDLRPAP